MPSSVPMMMGALGFPNGVERSCSETSFSPGMLYSPEPPMMARVGLVFIGYLIYEKSFVYCTRKRIGIGGEGGKKENLMDVFVLYYMIWQLDD